MQGPSAWNVVVGKLVIEGSNGSIFVYNGIPALGNLIFSITGLLTTTTDPYGNHVVPLTGWYDNVGGFFTQIGAGFITFGTGSLSTGWTANTSVQNDALGNLQLGATGNLVFNGTVMTVP